MKKIHKFILKSYLEPFVLTFVIALFVLLMQFLWKYVEDLVGKGLEWHIIVKLLFYISANLIPMALPLAILLSSIMTFGNMGEHYELVSMKSSGMSLPRIMMPLIITVFFISAGAFYFSNNILPIANLKSGALLYDITHQKPAIDLKEGIFYNGLEGYTIRVGKKEKNGDLLKNLMIYDHTDHRGNSKVIIAKEGSMKITPDKKYMILTLRDGYSYEEQKGDPVKEDFPHIRSNFKEQVVNFDLSDFKLGRTDENLFKDNYQMLNLSQLRAAITILDSQAIIRKKDLINIYDNNFFFNRIKTDSTLKSTLKDTLNITPLYIESLEKTEQAKILETAINMARNAKMHTESFAEDTYGRAKYKNRHWVEYHRKFTLSFACLVLFFIGAPLGAIIKKGGLGMPVVISVVFFLFFHILSITGEKFVKEGVAEPFWGMWMASIILLPIGIFLTYKATYDSAIFESDFYLKAFNFFKRKKLKN